MSISHSLETSPCCLSFHIFSHTYIKFIVYILRILVVSNHLKTCSLCRISYCLYTSKISFQAYLVCGLLLFQVSNTFYFTFTLHSEATTEPGFMVRKVVPATEEEARRVIQRYDADHDGEIVTASHKRAPLEGNI